MYKMVPKPTENKVYSRNLASFPVHAAFFSLAVFYTFVKFIFNDLILHFPKKEGFFFVCVCIMYFVCMYTYVSCVYLCVYINIQTDRYACIGHIDRYECACMCMYIFIFPYPSPAPVFD